MLSMRAGLNWKKRKAEIRQDAREKATIVFPRVPVDFSTFSSNADSKSSGSGFISQAAISLSVAPWKQSSHTPNPSSERTGGPKTRQVMGRDA